MSKTTPEHTIRVEWASNDDLDDVLIKIVRALESDGFPRPAIRDRLSALVAVYNSHEERNRFKRLRDRLGRVARGGE